MDAVVRAAVARMGRAFGPKEQALVELLNDNYYDTVQSVVELREEETAGLAKEWGVPLRLLKEVRALCSLAATATTAAAPMAPATAIPAIPATTSSTATGPGPEPKQVQLQRLLPATAPEPGASPFPSAASTTSSPSTATPRTRSRRGSPAGSGREEDGEDDDGSGGEGRGGEGQDRGDEEPWGAAGEVDEGEGEEEQGDWAEEEGEEAEAAGEDEQGSGGGGAGRVRGEGGGSDDGSGTGGGRRAAALPEPAPDVVGIPIMERRCPDKFRFGHGSGRAVRLTERKRKEPYSLKPADTPPALAAELRAFELFCLHGSWEAAQAAAGEPLRKTTVANHVQCLRQALGWLHGVEGVPLAELGLRSLLPGPQRSGARRVHAFLIWLETERGVCKRSVSRTLGAIIAAAKFLFHEDSRVSEGDKPYSDVEVIKTLRSMYMTYERHTRVSGHVVDAASKWLDWPQYLALVAELRREAAGLKLNGKPRAPAEVAMSLQAYLIAAILACVPDRQRTLRELQVGRTLVKDAAGTWFIRHGHADYKTGGTYGERPPLVIEPGIYYELEEFIGTWRAHLQPKHDFLFTKRDGSAPLSAAELGRSFSLHAFRLTGRKVNPHMVRDMIVTYARSGHATEHELEALAVYMGHSLAEQRGTYDRRTKAQKVAPALGLLAKISGGGGGGAGAGAGAGGGGGGAGGGGVAGGVGAGKAAAGPAGAAKAAGALPAVAAVPLAPIAAATAGAGVQSKPAAGRASKLLGKAAAQPAAPGPTAAAAAAPAVAPEPAAAAKPSRARRTGRAKAGSSSAGEEGITASR
ncbi:hypothetical protein HYH02_011716 [Chlamydomonas schloesseri]|uniref:Uncharacterized protein n=1 Tax=Chlamydomonas schloesseri TaxID=2026947 RepID=A0A835W3K6_9CHLO|nr:hypothetical protein HYH02_011716 [Chlamydomonas schloesseri]|eukprot:KAG2436003.1 hypothetical protein HYH02_011716 [Chlamydomonas schloesseri]